MCAAINAALAMVSAAIAIANRTNDENYYLDRVKLHKLLYLAQWRMLQQYGRPLFSDTIRMYQESGPYVENLESLHIIYGSGEMRAPIHDDFVPPHIEGIEVIEKVLHQYGALSGKELIGITKDIQLSVASDELPTITAKVVD